ncbi:Cyclophilin type peptidyl-prolyl cis-trans isomerase/CLD [Nesidiocoris tenuis]|uniref:peptidylprolyl isomerase n=1 Tax=Nesidiocoris tenuis TaxID=355587 RepID=A0ABN7AAD3_9HEMI|nr:Cyclophilin type peptidyl-prolyl cis-trans isomerase/CLD [Nesidiocoris tenuis]
MAVVIETTIGDITVDLFIDKRPQTCKNFLKLCKVKYYNFSLFHSIQANFLAQTGDPTGSGDGGESIFGLVHGVDKKYYEAEKMPKIKHTKPGLLSMVNCGNNMLGSQFFITLGSDLASLDEHCVFAEVTEGMEVLVKLNDVICDHQHRPYQDVRITHTVILEDPYEDLPGMIVPDASPDINTVDISNSRIGADEKINNEEGLSAQQLEELKAEREAKARATILEIVGDLPEADCAPPENVLFVCKLNPVTTDDDLEIIFSRFGKVKSCEVIRDHATGDSLQYAFVEFEEQRACEQAFLKMDNVLIDDRRIHVDFSQSVSKIRWRGKGRGVQYLDKEEQKEIKANGGRYGRKDESRDRPREREARDRDRDVRERDRSARGGRERKDDDRDRRRDPDHRDRSERRREDDRRRRDDGDDDRRRPDDESKRTEGDRRLDDAWRRADDDRRKIEDDRRRAEEKRRKEGSGRRRDDDETRRGVDDDHRRRGGVTGGYDQINYEAIPQTNRVDDDRKRRDDRRAVADRRHDSSSRRDERRRDGEGQSGRGRYDKKEDADSKRNGASRSEKSRGSKEKESKSRDSRKSNSTSKRDDSHRSSSRSETLSKSNKSNDKEKASKDQHAHQPSSEVGKKTTEDELPPSEPKKSEILSEIPENDAYAPKKESPFQPQKAEDSLDTTRSTDGDTKFDDHDEEPRSDRVIRNNEFEERMSFENEDGTVRQASANSSRRSYGKTNPSEDGTPRKEETIKSKTKKKKMKRQVESSSSSSSDSSDSSSSSSSGAKRKKKRSLTVAKKYYHRGKLVKVVKKKKQRNHRQSSESDSSESSDSDRKKKKSSKYLKVVKVIKKRKRHSSDSESSSSEDSEDSEDVRRKRKKQEKNSKKKKCNKKSKKRKLKSRSDDDSSSSEDEGYGKPVKT